MKRRLFIGSSREAQKIADKVKSQIVMDCGDWLNAETWSDGGVFKLNSNALQDLVVASRRFDYGILVASKDDKLWSRWKGFSVPRDNVMFEMGMFLGSLGLTRAFLLVEEKTKLPTDYNGVTVSYYKHNDEKSIQKALDRIVKAINQTRNTYNLKPTASAALAIGYFSNFIQPLAKKRAKDNVDFDLEIVIPRNIKDVQAEIVSFKKMNPSTEKSVYDDNQRPRVNILISDSKIHWDIPTTLSTLYTMIDVLLPSNELGLSEEKQDWIEHELRTFSGTIEMMVENCPLCRGKIRLRHFS